MPGVLKARVGGAWTPVGSALDAQRIHWNAAWGVIGKGTIDVANPVVISTLSTQLATMTCAINADRRYRVTWFVNAMGPAGSAAWAGNWSLTVDGGGSVGSPWKSVGTVVYEQMHCVWTLVGGSAALPAGSHTLRVQLNVSSVPSPNPSVYTDQAFFEIEDTGPVTRVPEGTVPPTDWTPYDARYLSSAGFRQVVVDKGVMTTYTLALVDENKLLVFSAATAITLTVPTNAAVAFAVGSRIDFVQTGAGKITVAVAGGVGMHYTPSPILRSQASAASLVKIGTDLWLLTGDLT